MASDEQIRRMTDEIEKIKKQVTNLESKVRRRNKRLGNTFDLLERARIEFEIELLEREIRRWEIVEVKLSLPIITATANFFIEASIDELDWSRPGKA